MRPLVTWLIVGALVLVGLFAARDALRDEPSPKAAPTPTETAPPAAGLFAAIPERREHAAELREIGARGALWVLDARCRRSILQLPDLLWSARGTVPVTDCHGPAPVVDDRFGLTAFQAAPDTIDSVFDRRHGTDESHFTGLADRRRGLDVDHFDHPAECDDVA